jgi:hypothetical protein
VEEGGLDLLDVVTGNGVLGGIWLDIECKNTVYDGSRLYQYCSDYSVYGSCFQLTLLSSLIRSNLTTLCSNT